MTLAGVRPLVDRLDPHQLHQSPHVLAVHCLAFAAQHRHHATQAVERRCQVLLIDPAHQSPDHPCSPVPGGNTASSARRSATRIAPRSTTSRIRAVMEASERRRAARLMDQTFCGENPAQPSSSPIVSYSLASCASPAEVPSGPPVLPRANSEPTPASNVFFHAWIPDYSMHPVPARQLRDRAFHSRTAARATFALKSATCFKRRNSPSVTPGPQAVLGVGGLLATCPVFRGQLQRMIGCPPIPLSWPSRCRTSTTLIVVITSRRCRSRLTHPLIPRVSAADNKRIGQRCRVF